MSNGLLILFLLSFLPYFWLNKRKAKYNWESSFDKRIKLIPLFVIPYIAYFPYVILGTLILILTKFNLIYIWTMTLGNISASLIWYLLPNGVKRPDPDKIDDFSISAKLLRFVYLRDKYDTNGFPSGHVFHTLILSYFLTLAFPEYNIIFIIAALVVSISTVLIKQHYVVDIIGGILVTAFAFLALNILI